MNLHNICIVDLLGRPLGGHWFGLTLFIFLLWVQFVHLSIQEL